MIIERCESCNGWNVYGPMMNGFAAELLHNVSKKIAQNFVNLEVI
jgi:hypothetical protein